MDSEAQRTVPPPRLHRRRFPLRSRRSEPLLWGSSVSLLPKNEGDIGMDSAAHLAQDCLL